DAVLTDHGSRRVERDGDVDAVAVAEAVVTLERVEGVIVLLRLFRVRHDLFEPEQVARALLVDADLRAQARAISCEPDGADVQPAAGRQVVAVERDLSI